MASADQSRSKLVHGVQWSGGGSCAQAARGNKAQQWSPHWLASGQSVAGADHLGGSNRPRRAFRLIRTGEDSSGRKSIRYWSEKERARKERKRGFGFWPLCAAREGLKSIDFSLSPFFFR